MTDREAALRAELNHHHLAARAGATTQTRFLADLLTGQATIMGKPVQLTWPDGTPHEMTKAELAEFGEELRRRSQP